MQGSPIDLSGLADSIGHVFRDVLDGFSTGLPGQAASQGTEQLRSFWGWYNIQGINFIGQTPLTIITAAGTTLGVGHLEVLLQAVVTIAILLGATAYAGHHFLGWPGLEETASRVLVTVILTGSSFRLMIFSIVILNQMVQGVAHNFPTFPDINTGNAMITFVLLLLWVILALRLAIVMGKRVVWLAVLYVLAPPAFACWVHQKSAWITSTWAKLWVGWLVGQLIVVIVLVVGVTMAGLGGPGGYLLSIASLLVAYDAVHILAPSQGGVSASVGVGPIRIRF